MMRKLAFFGLLVFVISIPFQWLYLGNNFVSAANTLLAIYLCVRYKNHLR